MDPGWQLIESGWLIDTNYASRNLFHSCRYSQNVVDYSQRRGGGVSLPDPGASISISVGHTQGVNPVTVEYQWLDGERRLWSARAFQAVCRSMKYYSIKLNGRMDKMRLLMLGRFMVAGKQSICVRSLSASLRRFVASSCRPTRTSHNAVRVVRSAVWVQITTRQLWSRRNSYWVIFLTVEYFCRCIVPPPIRPSNRVFW